MVVGPKTFLFLYNVLFNTSRFTVHLKKNIYKVQRHIMYTHSHTHTHARTHARTHIHTHTHARTHTHTHLYYPLQQLGYYVTPVPVLAYPTRQTTSGLPFPASLPHLLNHSRAINHPLRQKDKKTKILWGGVLNGRQSGNASEVIVWLKWQLKWLGMDDFSSSSGRDCKSNSPPVHDRQAKLWQKRQPSGAETKGWRRGQYNI